MRTFSVTTEVWVVFICFVVSLVLTTYLYPKRCITNLFFRWCSPINSEVNLPALTTNLSPYHLSMPKFTRGCHFVFQSFSHPVFLLCLHERIVRFSYCFSQRKPCFKLSSDAALKLVEESLDAFPYLWAVLWKKI